MDFCFQIKKGGWKFYFAPKAFVNHMHRADLKALLKVWRSYGRAHGPLLAKYASTHLEFVLQFLPGQPRFKIPFFYKGLVYLGHFHLMHLFGLAFLVSLIVSFLTWGLGLPEIIAAISLVGLVYAKINYYYWCFFMQPRKKLLTFCKMKYLTNWAFMVGGLENIFKDKAFCVEPSF
jgi:hypothetical protein